MPVIRLLLLLAVLGGLSLLLVQNWSPVLPLVFLGMTTQSLPLAIWILLSVVAGAFTSLLITGLSSLSNYFVRATPQRRTPVDAQRNEAPRNTKRPSQPAPDSTSGEPDDDWENDANDDWDFEEADKMPNSTSQRSAAQNTVKESASTEPKTESQSGSYSYSYRASTSGVGKTESVYDADYRVITPPHQPINTDQEDDDWGFDDLEDEGESNSPNVRR